MSTSRSSPELDVHPKENPDRETFILAQLRTAFYDLGTFSVMMRFPESGMNFTQSLSAATPFFPEPLYRERAVTALSGLFRFLNLHEYDYVISCHKLLPHDPMSTMVHLDVTPEALAHWVLATQE